MTLGEISQKMSAGLYQLNIILSKIEHEVVNEIGAGLDFETRLRLARSRVGARHAEHILRKKIDNLRPFSKEESLEEYSPKAIWYQIHDKSLNQVNYFILKQIAKRKSIAEIPEHFMSGAYDAFEKLEEILNSLFAGEK